MLEIKGGRPFLAEAGVVKAASQAGLEARLASLYDGLKEILEEYCPQVVAMEEIYSKYGQVSTGLRMGHARGALFLAAAKSGVPVVSYSATRVKKSLTGNGRASKEQVQRMVKAELQLASLPQPADVADALAVALCHYQTLAYQRSHDL